MCLRPPRMKVKVVLLRRLTAKASIRYIRLCQFFHRLWCVCVRACVWMCVYLIGACDVNGKIHNYAYVHQKWANVYMHIYRPGPFSGKTPVVPSRRLLHPLHNCFSNLAYLLRMQDGHLYAINKIMVHHKYTQKYHLDPFWRKCRPGLISLQKLPRTLHALEQKTDVRQSVSLLERRLEFVTQPKPPWMVLWMRVQDP